MRLIIVITYCCCVIPRLSAAASTDLSCTAAAALPPQLLVIHVGRGPLEMYFITIYSKMIVDCIIICQSVTRILIVSSV